MRGVRRDTQRTQNHDGGGDQWCRRRAFPPFNLQCSIFNCHFSVFASSGTRPGPQPVVPTPPLPRAGSVPARALAKKNATNLYIDLREPSLELGKPPLAKANLPLVDRDRLRFPRFTPGRPAPSPDFRTLSPTFAGVSPGFRGSIPVPLDSIPEPPDSIPQPDVPIP